MDRESPPFSPFGDHDNEDEGFDDVFGNNAENDQQQFQTDGSGPQHFRQNGEERQMNGYKDQFEGETNSAPSDGGSAEPSSFSSMNFSMNYRQNQDQQQSTSSGIHGLTSGEPVPMSNENNSANSHNYQSPFPNQAYDRQPYQVDDRTPSNQADQNHNNINTVVDLGSPSPAQQSVNISLTPTSDINESNHNSNSNNQKNLKKAPAEPEVNEDVIELLDDDDDSDNDDEQDTPTSQSTNGAVSDSSRRQRFSNSTNDNMAMAVVPGRFNFQQRYQQARAAAIPAWMRQAAGSIASTGYGQHVINPGHALSGFNNHGYGYSHVNSHNHAYSAGAYHQSISSHHHHHHQHTCDEAEYTELPSDFVPTWKEIIPPDFIRKSQKKNQKKAYQLSLLNLSEFTITGLPLYLDGPPTPISGLRGPIKRISRDHGKAEYEKNSDGGSVGGRWKIPIGAYHSFVAYLQSDPHCVRLETIPQLQLKIASLGRARLEKDYPSAQKLNQRGVPFALASTLAPFQRGGVDFVLEREGMSW
jgi:hypothetical protein